MVAAAVAYLLRSVDVGAQAPTPFPVKMPSGHLAQRAARRYRRYGLLFLLLSSFSQLAHVFRQTAIHRPRKKSSRPPLSTTPYFNLLHKVDKYAHNRMYDEYCIFDDCRVVVLWMIKVE